MNYNSEQCSTTRKNTMISNLVEKNSQNIQNLSQSSMPVMVPIQEKDWDTMVELLSMNTELYPKIMELFTRLLTARRMEEIMNVWSESQETMSKESLMRMEKFLETYLKKTESTLEEMKRQEIQVGNRIDEITNASLEKIEWLTMKADDAARMLTRRKVQIQLGIGMLVSSITSVLSVLLCQLLVQ